MKTSAAVFSGTVTKIEKHDRMLTVTFAVDKQWKGDVQKTITVRTHQSGATCGYGFREKMKYLVYASKRKDAYSTNLCTRTKLYKTAVKTDLPDLGAGKPPA